jgi:phosphodiesterase/alkaline phosphatase D-like protein
MSASMWHRVLVALTAAFVLVIPASASAASVATTGGATDITSTSVVLHGDADPGSNDSSWYFQYGTGTSYGTNTPAASVAAGPRPVQAVVGGLTPGTTYHYRLVVVENVSNSQPTVSTGEDLTFTTPSGAATTGDATSVTSTSAQLNGVVDSNSSDSGWEFQYGTTTSYGSVTHGQAIGAGVNAVSAKLTGLKPRTRYHFRLVVAQSSYGFHVDVGEDKVFTTKSATKPGKFGTASLRSRRLTVHKGVVSIPFKCAGAAGTSCKGKVAIQAHTKKGTVGCGRANLSLAAGKSTVLHAHVSHGCAALLKRARHHRIAAKLRATFTTGQHQLAAGVTLVRR